MFERLNTIIQVCRQAPVSVAFAVGDTELTLRELS